MRYYVVKHKGLYFGERNGRWIWTAALERATPLSTEEDVLSMLQKLKGDIRYGAEKLSVHQVCIESSRVAVRDLQRAVDDRVNERVEP